MRLGTPRNGAVLEDTLFDVAIIGSGPAGYTAAIRGGEYKLKVALIEARTGAGRDLPARGLHSHQGPPVQCRDLGPPQARRRIRHRRHRHAATRLGRGAKKRKNAIINKHTKGLEFLMKKNKVTVISGYGKLTGPANDGVHTVERNRRPQRRNAADPGEEHNPRDRLRSANALWPAARRPHPDQHRNPRSERAAQVADRDWRGRGGS